VALLAGVALALPTGSVHPTTISLTTVGTATAVDAGGGEDGITWVLALGSEATGDTDVTKAVTDAIQLIGVRPNTGRAVAIGLPRDLWVELEDRPARLNEALFEDGTDGVAREVRELLGITPDVVLVTGFDGFLSMMGTVGDVVVDSPLETFTPEDGGDPVRRGRNTMDAEQALYYARARSALPGDSDFARVANHQRLPSPCWSGSTRPRTRRASSSASPCRRWAGWRRTCRRARSTASSRRSPRSTRRGPPRASSAAPSRP
jgi:LCP family protein required for cell wall assembly